MARVIRLTQTGGPELLESQRVEPGEPGQGEALLEHEAIGVMYLDVTQRRGDVRRLSFLAASALKGQDVLRQSAKE